MTTNNDFARPADLLESSNHAAELTARAHKAVLRADTLATLLALSVDGTENASRGAREAVRDLLHGDIIATRNALGEAARLLSLADPLGEIDTSPDHETLTLARSAYHTALAALGVDPLTLAA
jgi:hypothetical protein